MRTKLRRLRRTLSSRLRRLTDVARETRQLAYPVRVLLALEVLAGLKAATVAVTWAWRGATSFDPATAGAPPWWALAAAPVVGAAGFGLRQLRPLAAARRWHGVAVRRLDERWSKT